MDLSFATFRAVHAVSALFGLGVSGVWSAGCEVAPIELVGHKTAGSDGVVLAEVDTSESDTESPIFTTPRRYQIELTWRRAAALPEVPEPGASGLDGEVPDTPSGADLDLHLLHPFAVGRDLDEDGVADGWFDIPFDVHWNNARPSWDAPGDGDDGRLDRDDREGPGPEVITLDRCATDGFRIGVHHFADTAGTASIARVAVYVDDQRTFVAEARLLLHDLWEVGVMGCDGVVVAGDDTMFAGVALTGTGW